MRRGKANTKKPKTEDETEGVPENENQTETQDNGENAADSVGEANMEETTAQKRKPKRGKKQNAASGDTENAEPPEKKSKRVPKKAESASEEAGEEYEVEKVVDMKDIRGKRHFKIHWKGYGPESETWEKEDDLNCQDLIDEFLNQLPSKTKKKTAASKADKKKPKGGLDDGNANEEEYEVAEVMEMKQNKGKREFLVHWKGFSHNEDTWEPEENLKCAELIEEFLKKTKEDKPATPAKGGRGGASKSKKRVARRK